MVLTRLEMVSCHLWERRCEGLGYDTEDGDKLPQRHRVHGDVRKNSGELNVRSHSPKTLCSLCLCGEIELHALLLAPRSPFAILECNGISAKRVLDNGTIPEENL
jgi:hypothetical protein